MAMSHWCIIDGVLVPRTSRPKELPIEGPESEKAMVRCSTCRTRMLKSSYNKHAKIHDPNASFQCGYCHLVFHRKDALLDHRLSQHGDYTERDHLRGTVNPKQLKRFATRILRNKETAPDAKKLKAYVDQLKDKRELAMALMPAWKPTPSTIDAHADYDAPGKEAVAAMDRQALIQTCITTRHMLKEDKEWQRAIKEADDAIDNYD